MKVYESEFFNRQDEKIFFFTVILIILQILILIFCHTLKVLTLTILS
jgi:hypothetical protein